MKHLSWIEIGFLAALAVGVAYNLWMAWTNGGEKLTGKRRCFACKHNSHRGGCAYCDCEDAS
jgi:hypothetical protein